MAKRELRKKIRALNAQFTPEQRAAESARLMAALEAHPAFRAADTVMLFAALPDEPDTLPLLERWQDRKQLLLPLVVGENMMEVRTFRGLDSLRRGAFDILEPTGPAYTTYRRIDLIVVPGMAFDAKGRRLGRGKGFYDRFLIHPDLSARKIGICFPHQFVSSVPTDDFDVPVDEVIH